VTPALSKISQNKSTVCELLRIFVNITGLPVNARSYNPFHFTEAGFLTAKVIRVD
jgi:hypothetical protein